MREVRTWVGEEDRIFPPQTAQRMVELLREYGNDVVFVVSGGVGHSGVVTEKRIVIEVGPAK